MKKAQIIYPEHFLLGYGGHLEYMTMHIFDFEGSAEQKKEGLEAH